MIELSAARIAALTEGRLTRTVAGDLTIDVAKIGTDSRETGAGSVYVAKVGEHADGHDYIPAAIASGAVLVLAERELNAADGAPYPAVIVPDAVAAMGLLAAEVVRVIRAAGELTVVGITGSAGKTTTKDLLAGVFARVAETVAPQESFNGEIGVPLTVFRADLSTRFLVVEMGATKIGHIQYLAQMVEPDIGVVLGVGSAHSGEFGGVANIAQAKGEMVEALGRNGTAVLNLADNRVSAMAARKRPEQRPGHPGIRPAFPGRFGVAAPVRADRRPSSEQSAGRRRSGLGSRSAGRTDRGRTERAGREEPLADGAHRTGRRRHRDQ